MKNDTNKIFLVDKINRNLNLNKLSLVKHFDKGDLKYLENNISKIFGELNSLWEELKNSNHIKSNASKKIFNLEMHKFNLNEVNLNSDKIMNEENLSVFPREDLYDYQFDVLRDKGGGVFNQIKKEINMSDNLINLNESQLSSDLLNYSLFLNNQENLKLNEINQNEEILNTNFQTNEFNNKKKRGKRTKYKMFPLELKIRCLQMLTLFPINEVALLSGVPIKSLQRWINVGAERKKGCGRKIRDEKMEEKLINWYNNMKSKLKEVTPRMIRKMAIRFKSNFNITFIASNGWLEKFKKKYNLILARKNNYIKVEK